MAAPKYLRISVDDPCKVPWEGMTPVDKEQRHCSSCDRVITDFSQMSDDELMLYFTHSKGKICGRFSNQQLNRPMPLLPVKTQPARWWRTLLLLPLALFSKNARAQYYQAVNGSDKTETAPVLAADDSVKQEELVVKNDSALNEEISVNADSSAIVKTDTADADTTLHVNIPSAPQQLVEYITVSGTIITTLGICTPMEYPSLPGFVDNTSPKKRSKDSQLASGLPPQNLSSEPEKTPEPQTPGIPANNDLNAILPEQRKRFWKS